MNAAGKALAEFVAEGTEILESLGKELLVLDQQRGVEPEPDIINSIFRAAHSLKGLSALFGQERIARLAHQSEDLLDRLRLGRLSLDDQVLDLLIESLDVLQALLAEAAREESSEGLNERVRVLGERLTNLGSASAAADEDPLDRLELDPQVRSVFTEYEEHRLRENVRRGVALFRIRAAFDLSDFDTGLTELNVRLKPLGEVVSTLPSSEPGGLSGIAFDLIFGSRVTEAELAAKLQGTPAQLFALSVRPSAASPAPSAPAPEKPKEPLPLALPPAEAPAAKKTARRKPRAPKTGAGTSPPAEEVVLAAPPLVKATSLRALEPVLPAPPAADTSLPAVRTLTEEPATPRGPKTESESARSLTQ
ncbi:MAG TPA: Hpt domain-containing protein, partial [Cystobacter sp.]